jgi:adenylosuccinate lyase
MRDMRLKEVRYQVTLIPLMAAQHHLLAITPLDGRYADKVHALADIVSEYGLIKRRVAVEAAWLAVLGSGMLPDVQPFDQLTFNYLKSLADAFTPEDAAEVKEIEKTTNHDVKSVEVWLRNKLQSHPNLGNVLELIHFGVTSEDINNIAYALQVQDTRDIVLKPAIEKIIQELDAKAEQYAPIPMLARTHGQPATPTTLGKELRVFTERLRQSLSRLESVSILAKFNGATGNFNALTAAYPDVDWIQASRQLIESFGFAVNEYTTQIEPHDWLAAFCNEAALANTIMTDLTRDMWLYISLGYFDQEVKTDEVGSSTMPHKVNPIDFENAEANFGVANAVLSFLAQKLPISRLQRDLSDSSALRTLGEAFGHTYIGLQSLQKGLTKIHANPQKIAKDLESEWSVLTEALQTVMRRYNVPNAYETIKATTRGKALSRDDYLSLVNSLDIPAPDKAFLQNLTPQTYIGQAVFLAQAKK